MVLKMETNKKGDPLVYHRVDKDNNNWVEMYYPKKIKVGSQLYMASIMTYIITSLRSSQGWFL